MEKDKLPDQYVVVTKGDKSYVYDLSLWDPDFGDGDFSVTNKEATHSIRFFKPDIVEVKHA